MIVVVPHADGDVGRAIALAVGARGARVVVAGERERVLGEVVGEIVHAGGQARHVVGGAHEGTEKALTTWGRVDFVAAGNEASAAGSPEVVAENVAEALVRAVSGAAREP